MNNQDIHTAYRRVIKHLTVDLKINVVPLKIRRLVNVYAQQYNLTIDKSKKKWERRFLIDELYRQDSTIFKDKKQTVVKKTKRTKKQKTEKKAQYNAYLRSAKWISFRNMIKEKRGNKCEKCEAKGVELHGHHLTYERFMNELESDIQILCKPCHKEVHKRN